MALILSPARAAQLTVCQTKWESVPSRAMQSHVTPETEVPSTHVKTHLTFTASYYNFPLQGRHGCGKMEENGKPGCDSSPPNSGEQAKAAMKRYDLVFVGHVTFDDIEAKEDFLR